MKINFLVKFINLEKYFQIIIFFFIIQNLQY